MTTTETVDASGAPAELNLAVGGMTCAGCASTVQRGLAILPGVREAAVNIATRRATVLPDGTLDPAELDDLMRAAITGLGYKVLTPAEAAGASAADVGPAPGDLDSQAAEHAAHETADKERIASLRSRFMVSATLALPTVLISMIPALQFAGWQWVAGLLATPVVFYGGWPFHRSTLMTARHGATTMDTLVTVGSLAAWGFSVFGLLGGAADAAAGMADGMGASGASRHVYFETAAVIITLILLGKWLEVRSTSNAGAAIRALSSRQSATATLEDGTVIPRSGLEVGMRFVVLPGQAVATDGVVVSGEAAVDSSLVTGESVPVVAGAGAMVVGGAIATDGSITVEATKVGSQTMLAQIARMVDAAQSGKANIQRLADRIAAIFVPVVLVLAASTLVGWLIATSDWERAIQAAVAVLIISCPCALGLATPLAVMVGTGRGAQLGVLIRGPRVLEDTRALTAVVFDKTGTLTEGRMSVTESFAPTLDSASAQALLAAAAAVESKSEHPVAKAITAAFGEGMLSKGFRSFPGRGAVATVQGALNGANADVTVGVAGLFDEVPEELSDWAAAREASGHTVVFVGRNAPVGTGLLGAAQPVTRDALVAKAAIAVRDQVKPGAADAVASLKARGLAVSLLTGDNPGAANAVAKAVGIDTVFAQVLPGEKAAVIEQLRAGGARVAMVGDGVNDAAALAVADIGIALGTGTDVAREASDLTIVSGDVRAVGTAIALARRTFAVIRGNLFWAFAYNVVAIPLAAAGLLNPMIAAAAMGASSLFVVGNSLRLRSFASPA